MGIPNSIWITKKAKLPTTKKSANLAFHNNGISFLPKNRCWVPEYRCRLVARPSRLLGWSQWRQRWCWRPFWYNRSDHSTCSNNSMEPVHPERSDKEKNVLKAAQPKLCQVFSPHRIFFHWCYWFWVWLWMPGYLILNSTISPSSTTKMPSYETVRDYSNI